MGVSNQRTSRCETIVIFTAHRVNNTNAEQGAVATWSAFAELKRAREAADSIKPGVERRVTPGANRKEVFEAREAADSIKPGVKRSEPQGDNRKQVFEARGAADSMKPGVSAATPRSR